MSNITDTINDIKSVDELVEFLYSLANDYRNNENEWENGSIDGFIDAVAAYINDSAKSLDKIDWNDLNLSKIARLFYMGKIYE